MAEINYTKLPFDEAIDFFRQKINLPTRTWTDIWEGMHARAFVIAGATKEELLNDFRTAIDKAISEGTTLEDFRRDFDAIVQRHGWSYKGGRGWRTRVMYETNIRQAYNAGREKQMQDPELRRSRPYALYRHGDSLQPRPEHLANDGVVLPLDDPWWDTWTPQNGWGCSCKKFMVNERDVKRLGLKVLDKSPPLDLVEKTVGKRGPSPRTVKVPKGIDPGFAYNPGTAAWGKQLSDDTMQSWRAQKADSWEPLTFGGPETFNRPDRIPFDKPQAKLGPRLSNQEDVTTALKSLLNADEKVFQTHGLPVLVNAETLAAHIDVNRSEYVSLLDEALNDPFEIWMNFERHKGTGQVVMRSRFIKAFQLNKGRSLLIIANAVKGLMEAWTFIPTSKVNYVNNQRRGILLWGRK